jgi:hypothetical protein
LRCPISVVPLVVGVCGDGSTNIELATWAGLGVIFKNSAKLSLSEAVLGPKPSNESPPHPGVDIIEKGRGAAFDRAEGRDTGVSEVPRVVVGELIRRISRFVSPSPIFSLCESLERPKERGFSGEVGVSDMDERLGACICPE